MDHDAKGCLPICAAGNDPRGSVQFPANNSHAVAVSAVGYKGAYPDRGAPDDA